MDKVKIQSSEEKQRLVMEAGKQLREAVSSVKVEIENKLKQAQALAVQEALKETNVQSSSKEVTTTTTTTILCCLDGGLFRKNSAV